MAKSKAPKVTFNGRAIEGAAQRAFEKTMRDLGKTYTQVIQDPSAFPAFPGQDIVDTGDLRDSQQITFPKPGAVSFEWKVPYAPYVHEGFTLQNGRSQPPRRWTVVALERINISSTFAKYLSLELGKTRQRGTPKQVRKEFAQQLDNFGG